MNDLRFRIKDYHAIRQADIILNGLTVISGENGCGKSTISRWMYYIVNGIQNYEDVERESFAHKLEANISKLAQCFPLGSDLRRRYRAINLSTEKDIESISEKYQQILSSLERDFKGAFESPKADPVLKRRITLMLSLDTSGDGAPVGSQIEEKISSGRYSLEETLDSFRSHVGHHDVENLKEQLADHYGVYDQFPESASFYEGNYRLIQNNRFEDIPSIQRAIYVDTATMPFDDGGTIFSGIHENLQNLLCKTNPNARPYAEIIQEIDQVIDGSVALQETDFGDNVLMYQRGDGLSIPLTKAATGVKSFAVLFRLVECGYIDENTLLIIDEPESHLHPQWVVEYARLLVMMNKVIGTRIVVASHDPDMVAALQAVAKQKDRKDFTHFYLAYPAGNKAGADKKQSFRQYEFRDLGMDVSPIFDSFNIAIDRIGQYERGL